MPSPQLQTFEEADAALRVLGQAQRELAQLQLDAQAKIDAAKARLAEARIGADAVVQSTTKLLKKFVERHMPDIEARGGKTVRLAFGRIGMRTAPPALVIDKGHTEADVIHWLHVKFPKRADDVLIAYERLEREELKLWDDADLAEIGVSVQQREMVVIEPSEDVPSKEVA